MTVSTGLLAIKNNVEIDMDALIEKEKIAEETEKKTVYIFVCTGNTCRSPMAAALFNFKYSHIANAISCGVRASGRTPIAKGAVAALRDRGVPPDEYVSHISRPAERELLDKADRIICMTGDHANLLMLSFPDIAEKIYTMPRDIFDPYGCDDSIYRKCLDDIEAGLDEAFGEGGHE